MKPTLLKMSAAVSGFTVVGFVCKALIEAQNPWLGVMGLLLAVPYWLCTYVPAKVLYLLSIVLSMPAESLSLPPPIYMGVIQVGFLHSLLLSVIVGTSACFLYAGFVRVKKRPVRTIVISSALVGCFITWLQILTGPLADTRFAKPIAATNSILTEVLGNILRAFYTDLPILGSLGSTTPIWRSFIDRTFLLTMLTSLMVFSLLVACSNLRDFVRHKSNGFNTTVGSPRGAQP